MKNVHTFFCAQAARNPSRRVIAALLLGVLGFAFDSAADPVVVESTPGKGLTLTTGGAGAARGGCIPETLLEGCSQEETPQVTPTEGKGMQVVRQVRAPGGQKCVVTETFTPTKDSIRWEMAVACDNAKPWTTPLIFRLKYPATANTRFWTTWIEGASCGGSQPGGPGWKALDRTVWGDPLAVMPLTTRHWEFGQDANEGAICIPIATLLEPQADAGMSLVMSPDQHLLRVSLATEPDGTVQFRHEWLRLGENRTVKLEADLVSHEADWRGGLRWMVDRYPDFFNPPNPKADDLGGTASYSHHRGKLDEEEVARLKKMAYRFNWAATFDWPYFGMYLPPMPNADATWETSGHNSAGARDPKRVLQMSYRKMNDECRYLKEDGFYQLSYFNVTEFGSEIGKPDAVKKDLPEDESWKDATTMLYRKFPNALLKSADGKAPLYSWGKSVVVDVGDPAFRAHVLEMAQRHIDALPDAAGICIDRMDWMSHVNYGADDGIGWYPKDQPGRLLLLSWNNVLPDLAKIMHSNGKVVFGNLSRHGGRLDVVRELDGFYDEFGYDGYSLNASGLLALRKPATMWTFSAEKILPDTDSYFQRHLYMGAFPTAPFPENDHTIQPSPKNDQPYLDYGPLLDAMRGKKWALEPHCIEAAEGLAKVNLFNVPGGWVAPVVFGPKDGTVKIVIRNVPGIAENLKIDALLPGVAQPQPVQAAFHEGSLELQVPLQRGCAMVRIQR